MEVYGTKVFIKEQKYKIYNIQITEPKQGFTEKDKKPTETTEKDALLKVSKNLKNAKRKKWPGTWTDGT